MGIRRIPLAAKHRPQLGYKRILFWVLARDIPTQQELRMCLKGYEESVTKGKR